MADLVYSIPRPTYPVAFTGTIAPGGWFTGPGSQVVIPRIHRREGDTEDNPVSSYTLTFEVTTLGTANHYVLIYDSISTTPGLRIDLSDSVGRQPWVFQFDNDLRMACGAVATTYFCLARYYLPIRA